MHRALYCLQSRKQTGNDQILGFQNLTIGDEIIVSQPNKMTDISNLEQCVKTLRPQIKYMSKQIKLCQSEQDFYISEINFMDFVKKYFHPVVWNFLLQLTLSEREYSIIEKEKFDWNTPYTSTFHATKDHFYQRVFLVGMINYIFTSGECKQPAHMYVSDIVDKFSHSSDKALKYLNQFGITVSPSVFTEHKICQAIMYIINIPNEVAYKNAFTQASADNVNKRSTGA